MGIRRVKSVNDLCNFRHGQVFYPCSASLPDDYRYPGSSFQKNTAAEIQQLYRTVFP